MQDFNEKQSRFNTRSLKFDGSARKFGASVKYPLWVADMDFKTNAGVISALENQAAHGIFGYEELGGAFYDAIRTRYAGAENAGITYLCGVVTGLYLAVKTLTKPDDEIIIQPPVYPPFFQVVQDLGRRLVLNPLKKGSGGYEMDLQDLRACISKKTKMLLLCNPANPVGRVWSADELSALEALTGSEIVVISDEIHADLAFEKFTSFYNVGSNCVCLNSPSKAYNLAGLNTAYAVSKNAEFIEKIAQEYAKNHYPLPNNFGVSALLSAYGSGRAWLDELKNYIWGNVLMAKEILSGTLIEFFLPQGTYLLWLDFSACALSHEQIRARVLELGVALNDGTTFCAQYKKYFRLNLATQRGELEQALKLLAAAFAKN